MRVLKTLVGVTLGVMLLVIPIVLFYIIGDWWIVTITTATLTIKEAVIMSVVFIGHHFGAVLPFLKQGLLAIPLLIWRMARRFLYRTLPARLLTAGLWIYTIPSFRKPYKYWRAFVSAQMEVVKNWGLHTIFSRIQSRALRFLAIALVSVFVSVIVTMVTGILIIFADVPPSVWRALQKMFDVSSNQQFSRWTFRGWVQVLQRMLKRAPEMEMKIKVKRRGFFRSNILRRRRNERKLLLHCRRKYPWIARCFHAHTEKILLRSTRRANIRPIHQDASVVPTTVSVSEDKAA